MRSASHTSVAAIVTSIAQPTTRRLPRSTIAARYSQPSPVGTYVMSLTQRRLIAPIAKLRDKVLGAGETVAELSVVRGTNERFVWA